MTPLCMMQGIKQWNKSTLTGDALCIALLLSPHNIWSVNTFLALIVSIMTLMVPLGLNVTNATPHSIYNVGHGSQKLLSRPSTSCVLFTAIDSSNCVGFDSILLCNVSLAIAWKDTFSIACTLLPHCVDPDLLVVYCLLLRWHGSHCARTPK